MNNKLLKYVSMSVAKGLLVYHREILRVLRNLRKKINPTSLSLTEEEICCY